MLKRLAQNTLTFIFICAAFLKINAQANFELKDILSAPFPTNLITAPNGDHFAWVFNQEGERNIWIASGPKFKGKPITEYKGDNGQEINSLSFTPDGKKIIYVRGGAPNRRGEIPNPRSFTDNMDRSIWMIATSGDEPVKLAMGSNPHISPDGKSIAYTNRGQIWQVSFEKNASPKQLFQMRGGAQGIAWSPDGSKIVFSSGRGDHSFIGIYSLDGAEILWVDPSIDHDQNPVWSSGGSQIAFIRSPHNGHQLPFFPHREGHPWSIRVADAITGKSKEVWKAETGPGSVFHSISASSQIFWGKGDNIVFPWEGNGWTNLYRVSSNGGEATCLTPGKFEVQYVSISPDKSHIIYSGNQNDIDRQHVWRVSVNGGDAKAISNGEGIEWTPVISAKNQYIAFLTSGAQSPAAPAYFDQSGVKRWLAEGTIPKSFPESKLVKPEQVIFSATDGMKIHGQLFLPKEAQDGDKRPAVVFFHGGSRRQMLLGFHHRDYYHNAYALNQYLVNQGYVVLSVNYRSGIGYGMEFREALNYGAAGASEFNDVMGAGLYLQNRAEVDPSKIGLWGGSYGGYLTALGLSRASDLFAAGVDIHGVHDWNKIIQNFVPSYNSLALKDIAKSALESSPVWFLDGWRSPVLLIHGDDDRNVPFNETVALGKSLRDRGVYFEQLVFPDEVHGFLLHRNWVEAYEGTADFFDRMLKK